MRTAALRQLAAERIACSGTQWRFGCSRNSSPITALDRSTAQRRTPRRHHVMRGGLQATQASKSREVTRCSGASTRERLQAPPCFRPLICVIGCSSSLVVVVVVALAPALRWWLPLPPLTVVVALATCDGGGGCPCSFPWWVRHPSRCGHCADMTCLSMPHRDACI